MKTCSVLIPLASGFEEIEAITIIDILRRAGMDVIVAGLTSGTIEASRKTRHLADIELDEVKDRDFDAVVLPGGQGGTDHLMKDPRIGELVLRHFKSGKWICAICAAPAILNQMGILKGKKATSHPAVREKMEGVDYQEERIVVDGKLVTSRGAGTAMEFAFKLIELFAGGEKVREVNQGVLAKI